MKLVLRRAGEGAMLFGAVLLATMSAGCTEEQTAFFIRGNIKIEAPGCIARPEGNTTLLSTGTLDVGLRLEYNASLLVGSQLAPRGDKTNLRTETMVATMTGAEIYLRNDVGELASPPFTVPATGVITPDSADGAGFGIVTTTLIPATFGLALRGIDGDVDPIVRPIGFEERRTFVAEIIVYGRTIGGLDVESSPLTYVLEACKGCVVDFPSEALVFDPAGAGSCGPSDEAQVPPCRVGQDDSVDCRVCAPEGNPYCIIPNYFE
jgi:hypothetical protein